MYKFCFVSRSCYGDMVVLENCTVLTFSFDKSFAQKLIFAALHGLEALNSFVKSFFVKSLSLVHSW